MLFYIVQALSARRLTVNHTPARRNIGESWPQAVLFLVVDQDKEAAAVIIEWIIPHKINQSFIRRLCKAARRGAAGENHHN